MYRKSLSERKSIAEGLNDKIVWDEAKNLDVWLDTYLSDDSDNGCDSGTELLEQCEGCGQSSLLCGALVSTRDVDEGMHGPVYHVCRRCYEKQQAALQAEFDRTMLEMDNRSFDRAS